MTYQMITAPNTSTSANGSTMGAPGTISTSRDTSPFLQYPSPSPSPRLFKLELIDEEDFPSPPLSPISVTDNLSQLAIRSFPLPDQAWTYLEGIKKKFHDEQTAERKEQVWKINEFISRHFIKGIANALKEQAQEIESSKTASSTEYSPNSSSDTLATQPSQSFFPAQSGELILTYDRY
jgi:hypothetical protein